MVALAQERGVEPSQITDLISKDLPADTPLNVDALRSDISIVYLFGMIDQLKDSIVTKGGMIRAHLAN
jgi:hypothetical protein